MKLTTSDGAERRADVLDSLGTPARPMSDADLCRKFDRLVAPTGLAMTGADLLDRLRGANPEDDAMPWLTPFLTHSERQAQGAPQ